MSPSSQFSMMFTQEAFNKAWNALDSDPKPTNPPQKAIEAPVSDSEAKKVAR